MKKETGSRRYPFRNQTLAGAKHRAKFMDKEICCHVHEDDSVLLVRVKPDGKYYTIKVLSMPLLPC